ncbi:hypothetical protein HK101_012057, partial [Irineochytrium annulatum]
MAVWKVQGAFKLARQLWQSIGRRTADFDRVRIQHGDITTACLSSRYRNEDLAVGVVSATLLGARMLKEERSGCASDMSTTVDVDARAVVASFVMERFLKIEKGTTFEWAELSGNYKTHHELAALKAVGLPEGSTRDELRARLATLKASEVVTAAEANGGATALYRTPEDWGQHPMSAILRESPIISIHPRPGPSPAPSSTSPPHALSGIKVLDVTRVLAGPIGADVLHVSSPNLPALPSIDPGTMWGKRSCHLDLKQPDGKRKFEELVKQADVVVVSYRTGAFDAMGLGPDDLHKLHPGIVTVSVSAYGVPGSSANPLAVDPATAAIVARWRTRRGYDSNVQVETGLTSPTANGDALVPLPCQTLDYAAGWLAALGAIESLRRRRERGGGYHVEVSLARTAVLLESLGPKEDAAQGMPKNKFAAMIAGYRIGME